MLFLWRNPADKLTDRMSFGVVASARRDAANRLRSVVVTEVRGGFKAARVGVETAPMLTRRFQWICFALWSAGLGWGTGVGAEPAVQRFSANLEHSRWEVKSDRAGCGMSQDIPRFGVARFEQRPGHRLEFTLSTPQPPVTPLEAQLVSVAPPWKHGFPDRKLGDLKLEPGRTPLRVSRDQALRIYYELEQGMAPELIFRDWGDGQDRVEVALSPVRFRQALADFTTCTDQLLYLDFEPLSEDQVYFDTNSTRLTLAARHALDKLAADHRRDRSVRFILGGHADERGSDTYNMTLSRGRAEEVARYLRTRGVAGSVIETRYFGESQPVGTGSGAGVWAQNRRVTVWIAQR